MPRVRHYATLVPLGTVMIALGLAWLHQQARRFARATSDRRQSAMRVHPGRGLRVAAQLTGAGLAIVPLLLAGASMALYSGYQSERLSRADKNNVAYLAVLDAVSASGATNERLYLDGQLGAFQTLTGGRMLAHLRYAFEVGGQEYETIEVHTQRLPVGDRGVASRRLILRAETVSMASRQYRLVPLPGEPGQGAPLRAFRAFPRRSRISTWGWRRSPAPAGSRLAPPGPARESTISRT